MKTKQKRVHRRKQVQKVTLGKMIKRAITRFENHPFMSKDDLVGMILGEVRYAIEQHRYRLPETSLIDLEYLLAYIKEK